MKITSTETFLVEGIKYNWTLMKIETDAGIHGWGVSAKGVELHSSGQAHPYLASIVEIVSA